ncbi:MAG: peptidase [Myxococcales bacterium]|nr:peptidase [Myxococcales bacterium]
MSLRVLPLAIVLGCAPAAAAPDPTAERHQLARDIYQELVEINTTQSTGDTHKAAQAMAARLVAAGYMFDVRAHGKDERVSVKAFETEQQYLYELVKMLAGGK